MKALFFVVAIGVINISFAQDPSPHLNNIGNFRSVEDVEAAKRESARRINSAFRSRTNISKLNAALNSKLAYRNEVFTVTYTHSWFGSEWDFNFDLQRGDERSESFYCSAEIRSEQSRTHLEIFVFDCKDRDGHPYDNFDDEQYDDGNEVRIGFTIRPRKGI